MKNVIILVVLAVGGYFAYQHFFNAPQGGDALEEDEAVDSGDLPPVPANCERMEKTLQNAIYGAATGEVSVGQRNTADRKFRACLREAGFSDSEINGTVGEIEERVAGYLEQDEGG